MLRSTAIVLPVLALAGRLAAATWTAGDGTFTNPHYCEKFSDPDLIRVGDGSSFHREAAAR